VAGINVGDLSQEPALGPDQDVRGTYLLEFGLPTGFQGIMVNVGGVMLLRFVGSLAQSAEAQAAYTVGYTQLFSLITWTSVGLMGATAAVAGQNLGAGKPERSLRAPKDAAKIGLTVASIIGLMFYTMPDQLLGIFGMNQPVVLGIGKELLQYLAVSGLFITVALAFTGGLQGTGDTRSPMYISLIAQIAVPIGLSYGLQTFYTLEASGIWTAILLGHFTRCTLSFLRFNQGKWQDIKVEIRKEAEMVS
jgi:Na+-driven multidrug efflux pump